MAKSHLKCQYNKKSFTLVVANIINGINVCTKYKEKHYLCILKISVIAKRRLNVIKKIATTIKMQRFFGIVLSEYQESC